MGRSRKGWRGGGKEHLRRGQSPASGGLGAATGSAAAAPPEVEGANDKRWASPGPSQAVGSSRPLTIRGPPRELGALCAQGQSVEGKTEDPPPLKQALPTIPQALPPQAAWPPPLTAHPTPGHPLMPLT